MSRSRLALVLVLLAAVVAMVVFVDGREGVGRAEVLRSPVAASVGDGSASWYCAARDVGAAGVRHDVLISAVGSEETTVRLDGFGEDGSSGTAEVTVAPSTTETVDVGEVLGAAGLSVMLEASDPVVVEHRFRGEAGADQTTCSTFSSNTWYFPVAVTTSDATSRLSLFNPFPGDATVDIEVAFETGVRVPAELAGIVVPAGTTRVVELGEAGAVRREQFAFTVKARTGALVAELGQSFDGSYDVVVEGIRLVPGAREGSSAWSFAGGFADASASERVVVLNPTEDPVDVLVQVIPYGGLETLPEPFELTIPPLRYGFLDIDQESRVPPLGYHAITVESVDGSPVVAARSVNVSAAVDDGDATPVRPLATGGTTASPGSTAAARRWWSTGLRRDDDGNAVMLLHNPGGRSASAEVVAVDKGTGESAEPVPVEVPPGDSVTVTARQLAPGAATFSAMVSSDVPLVVERFSVFESVPDLSLGASVPVVEAVAGLERLGG